MKHRIAFALSLLIAGLWGAPRADAATAKYDMTVVSTTTLVAGTNVVSVMDQGTGYVYAAYTNGSGTLSILKVNISNSQVAGTLTVSGISGAPSTALIDAVGDFAYFAVTNTGAAEIIRINLSTFQIANTLTMNSGETDLSSGVLDAAHGFAYFAAPTNSANEIIKIRLSPFQRVSAYQLPPGQPGALVIDPTNTFLYVGVSNFPSSTITQIQLSSFLYSGGLTLPANEELGSALAIDPSTNFLYFGITDFNDFSIKIRRVNLNTLTLAPEYLAFLTVNGVNSGIISIALDSANGFGYFTLSDSPVRLIEVNLASLSYANTLTEPNVYLENLSGPFGPSLYVYAVDHTGDNDLLQVNLTPDSALPPPLLLTVNPTSVQLGSSNVTLMAEGTNFLSGASIAINGVPLSPTTFSSIDELQAAIPLADVSALGVDSVTVVNPDGQSSAIVPLSVVAAPPVITHFFPGAVSPNNPAPVVVKIFGTGFQPGSEIVGSGQTTIITPGSTPTPWGGTLLTTYVSAEELDAVMPNIGGGPTNPSLIVNGNYSFWVQNPDSQISNNRQFFVGHSLPTPQVTGLTPEFQVAGNPGFTLKVTGINFVGGSTVTWNAFDLPTTLPNPNELDAFIPATDIASIDVDSIVVVTPGEAGSAIAQFPVLATAPPVPMITNLLPGTTVAGSAEFTLRVLGSNFVNGATVTWNGANLSANFVNAGELDALIPATDVASVGVDSVVVVNPYDQTSSTANFTVLSPTSPPVLTHLLPSGALINSPLVTFKIIGSGFLPGASVAATPLPSSGFFWTSPIPAPDVTYISPQEIDVSCPIGDCSTNIPGTLSIAVQNPGSQSSNALNFLITNGPLPPIPKILGTSPLSAVAGGLAFGLKMSGLNFVNGSTVTWNNTDLPTTFAGNVLDVTIPAPDIASVGIDSIVVITPGNGIAIEQASSIDLFPVLASLPAPMLSTLQPSATVAGSPAFTLDVLGSNFVSGAKVTWNGSNLVTQFQSAGELNASIPAADVASVGIDSVVVINPDLQTSTTAHFTVTPTSLPPPILTTLTPGTTVAGSPGFTMQVLGSDFVSGAIVTWNGANLAANFINAGEMDASIPAADVASVGIDSIIVINPDLQTSTTAHFTVTPVPLPPPILTNLLPGTTVAGSLAFTLQVLGSGFVSGAAVSWNGANLSANFVGAGELDVLIPAADVASVGVDSVVVINPDLQTSTTAHFTVTPAPLPLPILTALTPGTTAAGSPAFTLQVLGSNFVNGAAVTWNGANLSTNFVSASELDASIPAADVASVGVDSVVVINPDLQTSATVYFAVTPALTAPAAPTNVVLGNPQQTSLDLSWTASAGATGYQLDVALDSGFTNFGSGGFQNKDLGNVTTYTIPGLSSATVYYVQIRAYNAVGPSANALSSPPSLSTPGTVTLGPPPPPPAPSLAGIPDQLPVNSQIEFDYPSGYSIRVFNWSFQPENSTTSGGPAGSTSFAPASGISFPTPAPEANLAPYNLSPGLYILSVQVEDTYGQFSQQAQKTITLVSTDLSAVRVYPDPWQANLHQGYPITFDHLPPGSTVKIFTISGHWVGTLSAPNGQAVWTDLKNDNGSPVATGIYYYLVTDGQGNKTHGKFGVIR